MSVLIRSSLNRVLPKLNPVRQRSLHTSTSTTLQTAKVDEAVKEVRSVPYTAHDSWLLKQHEISIEKLESHVATLFESVEGLKFQLDNARAANESLKSNIRKIGATVVGGTIGLGAYCIYRLFIKKVM